MRYGGGTVQSNFQRYYLYCSEHSHGMTQCRKLKNLTNHKKTQPQNNFKLVATFMKHKAYYFAL